MRKALSYNNMDNYKTLYIRDDVGQYQVATTEDILATARYVADEILADRVVCDHPLKNKEFLISKLGGMGHEIAAFLFLDTRYQLIEYREMFNGTLSQASVYPREIAKLALDLQAAAVVMAHNHPSGIPEPSMADIALTKHVKKSLELLDIKVLDHVIVAGSKAVSLAERGDF